MKAARLIIPLLAALTLSACPAVAAEPWLSLSGGGVKFTSQDRTVFPGDVPAIRANVAIPGEIKRRAEFVWRDPSGLIYSDTFKLLFVDKKTGVATGWDEVKVADNPPADMPGWWTVEVTTPGESLSVRFLLTKNRQEMVLVTGSKDKKIEYLKAVQPGDPANVEGIGLALADPDEEVRAFAVRTLRGADSPWAIKSLAAAQGDVSATVRAAAAEALAGKGGKTAFDALTRAAADDAPVVKTSAASRLPVGGFEEGSAALLGALVRDGDPLVRTVALASLAGMDGEPAMRALKEGFAVDDPSFRRGVLAVVIDRGGPGMYETLVRALDDGEPANRLAALKALGPEAAKVAGRLVLDPDEAVSMEAVGYVDDEAGFTRALGSPHLAVRVRAVAGLSALAAEGEGAGVSGLALAMKDEEAGVRRDALNGLVRAGRAGEAGIIAALGDPLPEVRLTAANALVNIGGAAADAALEKSLGDPEPGVRAAALAYFSVRGGDGRAGILARLACDPDPAVRRAALERLIGMKSSEATSRALSEFYACGGPETREPVIGTLAERDDPEAVKALEKALADADPGIRRRAAEALFGLDVREPLAGLSADPDPAVKGLALRAMSGKPTPAMLPELAHLVRDGDDGVRELALGILKSIPGDEAGGLVSGLADDRSAPVRDAARRILLGRRDEGSVAGLGIMAREDDDRGRTGAMSALAGIPGPKAGEALYGAFASGGPEVKVAALGYMAKRKDDALLRAATEGAADGDDKVGLAALDAAKALPEDGRDRVALAALASSDADVREAGLLWLRDRKGEDAAAGLMKGLDDPAESLRALALGSLSGREGVDLAPRLPALLADADPEVRRLALEAASRLPGRDKAAGLLIGAAGGPYADTAADAVDALLPMGDPRALPYFVKAYGGGRPREKLLAGMARVEGEPGTDALAIAYARSMDDEALRLAAAGYLAKRGDSALPALMAALDDPSRKVRKSVIESAKGLGTDARATLLGKAMADESLDHRKIAAEALAEIDTEGSTRALLPALDDLYLRSGALAALLKRGPAALDGVAGYLANIRDDEYRASVVKALASAGLDTERLSLSLDDPSPSVRSEAVRALSGRKGAEASAGLLYAAGDPDPRVRSLAAPALRGRGPEEVVQAAGRLVEGRRARPESLGFAADMLQDAGPLKSLIERIPADDAGLLAGALRPLIERRGPSDALALAAGLRAAGPAMKQNIITALVNTGGPDAGNAVRGAYADYPELRPAIIDAACRAGRMGDVIGMALSDADAVNRRAGAACMGALGEGGLPGALGTAMKDADTEVRLSAVRAAAAAGRMDMVAGAAGDVSPDVRKNIARALGESGRGDAAGPLGMLALDADPSVASGAARALERLGGTVQSKVWVGLVRAAGASTDVRVTGLNVLAGRNEGGSLAYFAEVLADKDRDIRDFAVDVLVGHGPESLPYVHPLLGSPGTRLRAMETLGRIGDPSSSGALVKAMAGLDGGEMAAAVDALGRTGGPEAAAGLVKLYREGPPAVRKAAVRAMGGVRGGGEDAGIIAALSDAVEDADDSVRLYAARSAGALKALALKDKLAARLKEEPSGLVSSAMEQALEEMAPAETAPRP